MAEAIGTAADITRTGIMMITAADMVAAGVAAKAVHPGTVQEVPYTLPCAI
jgi:hypothetical protein